ncbi:response regulator transcription factor [Marinoscillum sp. MHG1-6]|uniref:response regulator transcription factor n=1 Tax=Marinoscillum sp. MHG1-6 TaxID=2959627 RepID=UPI0021584850|nr:response regulator transcription factor [Marinoscillum sp. MHG1-6]
MDFKDLHILVVDDHTLFRKGMIMLLQTYPGIGKIMEAENGQAALDLLKSTPVDVVLLDIDMPVLDGKSAARKIVSRFPDVKIIMVSMHDSISVVAELIEIGVHSYLIKNAKPDEVFTALRFVINNDFYYSQIVSKSISSNNQREPDQKSNITKREAQILRLICQELTMKQIGEELFLSEQTVHTHRKNLLKKTQAKNTVGLVKFAVQNQIVSF